MLNFKVPRLIQIYQVKKGKAHFVCSCGRLASVPIAKYNRSRRCKDCEEKCNNLIIKKPNLLLTDLEYDEMFEKFYSNGLLDMIESFDGK